MKSLKDMVLSAFSIAFGVCESVGCTGRLPRRRLWAAPRNDILTVIFPNHPGTVVDFIVGATIGRPFPVVVR